jgi:hypothetical protein
MKLSVRILNDFTFILIASWAIPIFAISYDISFSMGRFMFSTAVTAALMYTYYRR